MAVPLEVDFSAVNTALILGAILYLYRQARVVDQVRQALLGMEGKGGALEEIRMLRQRTHDLSNVMTTLTIKVEQLTEAIASKPWDGQDRRLR